MLTGRIKVQFFLQIWWGMQKFMHSHQNKNGASFKFGFVLNGGWPTDRWMEGSMLWLWGRIYSVVILVAVKFYYFHSNLTSNQCFTSAPNLNRGEFTWQITFHNCCDGQWTSGCNDDLFRALWKPKSILNPSMSKNSFSAINQMRHKWRSYFYTMTTMDRVIWAKTA